MKPTSENGSRLNWSLVSSAENNAKCEEERLPGGGKRQRNQESPSLNWRWYSGKEVMPGSLTRDLGAWKRASSQYLRDASSFPTCHAADGSNYPVSHSPGQRLSGRCLSSIQGSSPRSSWEMSFGLQNGISAHKERKKGDSWLWAQGAIPELRDKMEGNPEGDTEDLWIVNSLQ